MVACQFRCNSQTRCPDLNCPFNDLPGQYIRGDTERAHHIGLSLAACGLDCFEASTGNSSPFGRIDQLHIEPNRGDRFSAAVFELERPQRTAQLHIGAHWGAIGNHGSRPPIAHEGFDDSVTQQHRCGVGPTHSLPSRQATIGLRNEQPLRIQDATTLRGVDAQRPGSRKRRAAYSPPGRCDSRAICR